jgi:hypothetical protein
MMVMLGGTTRRVDRCQPASLIDHEHSMGSWCDHLRDLREVQVLRLGVAGRQNQGRPLALFRADRTEDVGGGIPDESLLQGRGINGG